MGLNVAGSSCFTTGVDCGLKIGAPGLVGLVVGLFGVYIFCPTFVFCCVLGSTWGLFSIFFVVAFLCITGKLKALKGLLTVPLVSGLDWAIKYLV